MTPRSLESQLASSSRNYREHIRLYKNFSILKSIKTITSLTEGLSILKHHVLIVELNLTRIKHFCYLDYDSGKRPHLMMIHLLVSTCANRVVFGRRSVRARFQILLLI